MADNTAVQEVSVYEIIREHLDKKGGRFKPLVLKRAYDIFNLIVRTKRLRNGFPPTYREMGDYIGGSTISNIKNYLDILVECGLINLPSYGGIEVVGSEWVYPVEPIDKN